ncbi:MAG: dipeptide epimerase [Verrucomicrobia bacterium]|nr:dipeptide epimerase [Verrucomicrobiota bacterium]MCG2680013.1 dipeptide epimerase [Kiritimatiellia bacterium]MBU4247302.1 dipeptide epimerase [Verrucomicrobiota bacterium]MBU4290693.1 dipeptide epimerase [Verrucomicrobiota bacterium]MBU4428864.1 dipeptide epimerase [Verrucomicrobiota bacterium]
MKVAAEVMTFQRKHPFKIAREKACTANTSIKIAIEHDGVVGLGESKPSAYYCGETDKRVLAVVAQAEPLLGNDPFQLQDVIRRLWDAFPQSPAAVAGLDIALHDLVCKLMGVPLYKYFGLNPANTPRTSFTLGLDTIPVMLKKLEEAREYPILKIKVGAPGDVEILKAIRDNTDAVIRVDANTGWGVDEAIKRINKMAEYNIELVEQPIPPKNFEGLRKISRNTCVPIMADEDSVTSADLPALAGCVDSINIKLQKSRGLREAMRMIHVAKALGLKVMLGCMSECSIAITAAAHLSPLAEYADLDSNLLIRDDPYDGVKIRDGKLILPDRPGVGVVLRRTVG